MMRTIYLEGELALKFGEKFTIFAKKPSDVFKCLNLNFPNFREYLIDCHEKNINFACEFANHELGAPEELLLNYGEGDMILTPVPAGSKSGFGKILAAIALVAVVYFTGGLAGLGSSGAVAGGGTLAAGQTAAGWAVATGGGLSIAGSIAMTGVLMLANMGMAQMMAPDPSTDTTFGEEDKSYLYQGSATVAKAGDPLPIVYGRMRIPGRPAGVSVSNITRTNISMPQNTGIGTGRFVTIDERVKSETVDASIYR